MIFLSLKKRGSMFPVELLLHGISPGKKPQCYEEMTQHVGEILKTEISLLSVDS